MENLPERSSFLSRIALPMVTSSTQRSEAMHHFKLPSYLISGTKFSLTLYRQPSFQATITGSVKLYIRAGEFSKKNVFTWPKSGFLVKKMPPKSGGALGPIFPLRNLGYCINQNFNQCSNNSPNFGGGKLGVELPRFLGAFF